MPLSDPFNPRNPTRVRLKQPDKTPHQPLAILHYSAPRSVQQGFSVGKRLKNHYSFGLLFEMIYGLDKYFTNAVILRLFQTVVPSEQIIIHIFVQTPKCPQTHINLILFGIGSRAMNNAIKRQDSGIHPITFVS